jgi:hypothetical protein
MGVGWLAPLRVENARALVWVSDVATNSQPAWCAVVIADG